MAVTEAFQQTPSCLSPPPLIHFSHCLSLALAHVVGDPVQGRRSLGGEPGESLWRIKLLIGGHKQVWIDVLASRALIGERLTPGSSDGG